MDEGEDVIVVACGGAARNAFGINSKNRNYWELYRESLEEFAHPFHVVSEFFFTLPVDNLDTIRYEFRDKRIVVPFSILGGEHGIEAIKTVIACAREMGCKVVSVFGIPMGFEFDRRDRAFAALPEVASLSDCTMVLDMAMMVETNMEFAVDRHWTAFLKMSDLIMKNAIKWVIEFMQGPFFTVFTERLYLFVPASDVIPLNAVKKAWKKITANDSLSESSVILVASSVKSSEIEDICNEVVMESGIMPEVIRRDDSNDSKVLIFRAARSL